MSMNSFHRYFLAVAVTILLPACAGKVGRPEVPKVYLNEKFKIDSPFEHETMVSPAVSCEAGRKALLGQGYLITQAGSLTVQGNKFFQPNHDSNVKLEITITCVASPKGSSVFMTAKQTYYEVKETSDSADFSLAGMGSISLPLGSSSDNLIKVGESTVSDEDFYHRFFALFDSNL